MDIRKYLGVNKGKADAIKSEKKATSSKKSSTQQTNKAKTLKRKVDDSGDDDSDFISEEKIVHKSKQPQKKKKLESSTKKKAEENDQSVEEFIQEVIQKNKSKSPKQEPSKGSANSKEKQSPTKSLVKNSPKNQIQSIVDDDIMEVELPKQLPGKLQKASEGVHKKAEKRKLDDSGENGIKRSSLEGKNKAVITKQELSPNKKLSKESPNKLSKEESPVKKVSKEEEDVPTKRNISEGKSKLVKVSPSKQEKVSPNKQEKVSPSKKQKVSPSNEGKEEEETIKKEVENHPPLVKASSSSYSWKDYMNRGGPPMKGQKEVPVGAPNCLYGKNFLVTGVLDSLERDEAFSLIQQYGGAISKGITKKLSHAVVGREPGASKMEKIKSMKVTVLDEDGLFDLIRSSKPQNLSPKQQKAARAPLPTTVLAPIASNSKEEYMLWADKHKPQNTGELIGNPGPINQLKKWLQYWQINHKPGIKSNDPKAALLSGNPGIGKTSAAVLVAKECGYSVLEFNASDARGKIAIQERIAEVTANRTMGEFYSIEGSKNSNKKICLIMDEVDGMSSGDRGGMGQLILLIKKTLTPIICICNDYSKKQVRSLANYCLDLKFRKPTVQQAAPFITKIARKEGFAVQELAVQKVLESVNVDIRQALNLLQMWRSTSNTLTFEDKMKKELKSASKDIDYGIWDVVSKIFNPYGTVSEKFSYHWVDAGMIPLFVQENYINASTDIDKIALAAQSISDGDLIDVNIRKYQRFELSSAHAMLSTVRPAHLVQGYPHGISFPNWLGKNSSTTKRYRMLRDLKIHMSTVASGDRMEVRLQYLPLLKELLVNPIIEEGLEGVDKVLSLMEVYGITREDWDALIEIVELRDGDELLKKIPTNVKSTFTRRYNSTHRGLKAVPSKKSKLEDITEENVDELDGENLEEENEGEEDDIKVDKMIKIGKGKAKKAKPTKATKQPVKKKATTKKK